jgi:hypothetical protein
MMLKYEFTIYYAVFFVFAGFSACSGSEKKGEKPETSKNIGNPIDSTKSPVSEKKTKPPAIKKSKNLKDLKTYTGYLEIDPFRYGKAVQGVTVYTASGKSIGIEMRYNKGHMQYMNKKVVITGGMANSSNDPRVQSYSYFKVESIKLAPGEKPYAVIPSVIPPPPVVKSEKDIKNLPGGWGVAIGKCEFIPDPKNKTRKDNSMIINKVILKLDDGFKITKHLYHMVSTGSKDYKNGAYGTIIFKYYANRDKKIYTFKFCTGKQKLCRIKPRIYKSK